MTQQKSRVLSDLCSTQFEICNSIFKKLKNLFKITLQYYLYLAPNKNNERLLICCC
jgi:hypothetical protein